MVGFAGAVVVIGHTLAVCPGRIRGFGGTDGGIVVEVGSLGFGFVEVMVRGDDLVVGFCCLGGVFCY